MFHWELILNCTPPTFSMVTNWSTVLQRVFSSLRLFLASALQHERLIRRTLSVLVICGVLHIEIVPDSHTTFKVLSGQTVFSLRSLQGAVCLLTRLPALCEQPWAPHTRRQVAIQPKSLWKSLKASLRPRCRHRTLEVLAGSR